MTQFNHASQCSAGASEGSMCHSATCQNVGSTERTLSAVAGGLFLGHSLWGRVIPRPISFLIGAGLIYRALTGYCAMYGALGMSTADEHPQGSATLAHQHASRPESSFPPSENNRGDRRSQTDASLAATGEGGQGVSSERNHGTDMYH